MGTVGLSFGSPTSGTGFNVSSTVAAIVSNLQNVETPWKTQLTKLQSQDTVISNLGSLLSSVSTDLSQLTDFTGVMAEKTGSSSDTNVLELTSATAAATAGTHTVVVKNLAQTSNGYLTEISSASQLISGSITLQVGSGTAQTFTVSSSDNTLATLASTINSSGVGITASVLTDSSGSRLSLVSGTSGANGNITVTGNTINAALNSTVTAGTSTVTSSATLASVASPSETLTGSISIQVGTGTAQVVNVPTASGQNTLTGLMDAINNTTGIGVTASIVTNKDGSSSLQLTSGTTGSAGTLTVNSSVFDTQTSLAYTSPTAGKDASLVVDGVDMTSASNTVTGLIPGLTFQLLSPSAQEADSSLEQVQVVIGNNTSAVESTINSFVTDYNSLISAVNTQEGNDSSGNPEPLFGSPTLSMLQQQLMSALNQQNPNGSLTSVPANANTTLSGSVTIQVGSGSAQTITLDSSDNTLAGLEQAINAADLGVTASISTTNGESTLMLLSSKTGTAGALTITSSLTAVSDTQLSYSGSPGSSTTTSTGTLTGITNAGDTLTGSITIQVGSGAAQTVTVDSSNNTLQGLADAINGTAGIGVKASVVTNQDGTSSLSLLSGTDGSDGTLTVTSNILDATATNSAPVTYTNSSNLTTMANLGITVSDNYDGTISLDVAALESTLNSNFSDVIGFFQSANSWGMDFSTTLNQAGTSSSTGMLALAKSANSSNESTMNAYISKEQSLISAEQKSLTAEMNSANEILQAIPSQLQGIDELYSAITGYNQKS